MMTLGNDYVNAKTVYTKAFKSWLDEIAPTDRRQWLHRLEHDTLLTFEADRDFFMEVMVPELASFAKQWEIAIYYNHLKPILHRDGAATRFSKFEMAVVILHWAGEPGVTKVVPQQPLMLEEWKLPE